MAQGSSHPVISTERVLPGASSRHFRDHQAKNAASHVYLPAVFLSSSQKSAVIQYFRDRIQPTQLHHMLISLT